MCVHHNTVDTDDKARLGELEDTLSDLQHALYAFGLVAEYVQLGLDLGCDSTPDIVCAVGCTSVPAKGICNIATWIVIGINSLIIIGMDIASYGKQYTRN